MSKVTRHGLSSEKSYKVIMKCLLDTSESHCSVQFPLQLGLVWNGKHYAVLNKPPMVLSQPADKNTWYKNHDYDQPVLMEMLHHNLSMFQGGESSVNSCYPVHRIDSPVSGGIIIAKSKYAAQMFSRNLKNGGNSGFPLTRKYVAKVSLSRNSSFGTKGLIRSNGASTYFRFVDEQHVVFQLLTGKKHQIRKLCYQTLGTPIYNDIKYGGVKIFDSDFQIALHSAFLTTKIGFKYKEHVVPVPEGFRMLWGRSLNHEGYFNTEILDALKEDWGDEIKQYLLDSELREGWSTGNRSTSVT